MNKAEKQDRVDALRQQLAGIDAVIVAEYRGMTMEQMQSLRAAVRGAEGKVVVVKNTLARLSVKGTSLEALTDKLVGPVLAGTLRLVMVAVGGVILVRQGADAGTMFALISFAMLCYGLVTALFMYLGRWGD